MKVLPIKVLFVLDSLYGGGTERSTAVLLPLLRERGIDARVVVLRPSTGDEQDLRRSGFSITQLSATTVAARARELRAVIALQQPAIVHTALFAGDLVGRLGAWRTGAAVVSSLVNTPYDPARMTDPNISRWKLRAVQTVDAITARYGTSRLHAVSQGVADENCRALHYPAARITVVDRGRSRDALGHWSQQRREHVRQALGVGPDTKIVLTAGRQEYQKAHTDLVEAAAILTRTTAHAQLFVAGRQGNATAAVERLVRRINPETRVTLLGDRGDVADLLVAADVFCLSSRWEGTAGAALEAMALNCPIVSTDVAGLRGVLAHERNAVMVPANAPGQLAAGLRRVLDNASLANSLRSHGLRDFETRFTIERSADQMKAFYEQVLAEQRGQIG